VTIPPPYPRIPHLMPGRGGPDDLGLLPHEVAALLRRPLIVEEKLDGANVVIWEDGGRVECTLRSGPGALDRAGQLGPLRAWLGGRVEEVRALLADHAALYGEWLLLTHTVPYDALPAYLVGLDILQEDGSPVPIDDRNRVLATSGVPKPPELFRGVPETLATIESLLRRSVFGAAPMEGVVVRALDGQEPRMAKLIRPGFQVLDDAAWQMRRPRNLLVDREASWR